MKIENSNKLIFKREFKTHWFYIPLLFFLITPLVFLGLLFILMITSLFLYELEPIPINFWLILIPLGMFFTYFFDRFEKKEKPAWKLFDDRFEFYNPHSPDNKDIIHLSEIDQIRYEDDFGDTLKGPRIWFFYCYLINGYQSKSISIKKDRLKLILNRNDKKRIEEIILIFKFFQKKKKQIYIRTRHKEINEALNIRNWNQP